ncbi:MAG: hypothetical protein RTU30_13545 [Candidatus Thorarchaeota archaeon]
MTKDGQQSSSSNGGIIAKASLQLIRNAAIRVLGDCNEEVILPDGSKLEEKPHLDEGDQIIFKENMDPCPAVVVATNVGEDTWYVMSKTICPPSRCDDRQADKCARLEAQNMRIFQDFIQTEGSSENISEWRAHLAGNDQLQGVVDKVTRKWTH